MANFKERVRHEATQDSTYQKLVEQVKEGTTVDPTRSTGRRDSLLNEKKMLVYFRILENSSPRRNIFSLESPLTFCCYFIKGKTK